jgi:hypothetical protein
MNLEEKILAMLDDKTVSYEIFGHAPVYTNPEYSYVESMRHQTNNFELYIIALFIAEGDLGFEAFIRKASKKKHENPVDPVKKKKNKIESIPFTPDWELR